jgi:hypothetical protein
VLQKVCVRTCSRRIPTPNQPGRNTAEGWKNSKELEEQRRLWPLPTCENAADNPFLDGERKPLRKAHRQDTPLLDGLKIVVGHLAIAQRAGELVGGGNRVRPQPKLRSAGSRNMSADA